MYAHVRTYWPYVLCHVSVSLFQKATSIQLGPIQWGPPVNGQANSWRAIQSDPVCTQQEFKSHWDKISPHCCIKAWVGQQFKPMVSWVSCAGAGVRNFSGWADWGSDQSRVKLIGSCLYSLHIWQQILAVRFSATVGQRHRPQFKNVSVCLKTKLCKLVCQSCH